jgi:hypothetical protein
MLAETVMACAARPSFLINGGWCSSAGLLDEESHHQYQYIYFGSSKASWNTSSTILLMNLISQKRNAYAYAYAQQ